MQIEPDVLTPTEGDKKLVVEALRSAYDRRELNQVMRFGFGVMLDDYFDVRQGYIFLLQELVDWVVRQGKVLQLISLAHREKPGNPHLANVAQIFGISSSQSMQRFDPAAGPPAAPKSLEALVARSSRLTNVREFQDRFAALSTRVCRINTGFKKGTGFLVGPDLVLTNYHVLEEIIQQGGTSRDQVQFWFDDVATTAPDSPSTCGLAETWLVSSSPYSDSDVSGTGEPQSRELDYALLRLDAKLGAMRLRGGVGERGWFDIKHKDGQLAARHDVILVVQHPGGRPMEVAWGILVDFVAGGTRVRYNVTTEQGSSGSPCLTAELVPFALHHAADPKTNPLYNQGIPLALIAADALHHAGSLE